MIILLLALQLAGASVAPVPGQIDRVCEGQFCQFLSISGGVVRFTDSVPPPRTLVLGRFVSSARNMVRRTEAPIREIHFKDGGVVVSAFLHHSGDNKGAVGIQTRIFGSDGTLKATFDMFGLLEQADLGPYLGGEDKILAVTSSEEHAYNVQTEIWLLPPEGAPKQLLSFPGAVDQFGSSSGKRPGISVSRETYDGEHAETKGRVKEFWAWDAETKRLIAPAKH
jgi:hypothetical protein